MIYEHAVEFVIKGCDLQILVKTRKVESDFFFEVASVIRVKGYMGLMIQGESAYSSYLVMECLRKGSQVLRL